MFGKIQRNQRKRWEKKSLNLFGLRAKVFHIRKVSTHTVGTKDECSVEVNDATKANQIKSILRKSFRNMIVVECEKPIYV